ncbi:MAG: VWA domain-containing protein [Thermodesulfobacteriota bacterium]
MKKNYLKPLVLVGLLLALTCAALGYARTAAIPPEPPSGPGADPGAPLTGKNGVVSLTGRLSQTKVYQGGDGRFTLSLTLAADKPAGPDLQPARNVDLVIVLDRSGSMEGEKIGAAKRAVLGLLDSLSPRDRLALVSYSDDVVRHTGLLAMTEENRRRLAAVVAGLRAGGNTNLGAGLSEGFEVLASAERTGNVSRIILVSDGLANQGVTSPEDLGRMAASAAARDFTVSTVGVGLDFNEYLMTTLADRGAGHYHFLEDPDSFAQVFHKEFQTARSVAATAVEISVPLEGGLALVDAAGYPIEVKGDRAVFRPGDLLAGQKRQLFLTFSVPTAEEKTYAVTGVVLRYKSDGRTAEVALPGTYQVAVVRDENEAYASMDKDTWERQVIQEDFSRLREDVARSLGEGDERAALEYIRKYEEKQAAANAQVGSQSVTDNLTYDLEELRGVVRDTFAGSAGEVEHKQKANSKGLQFEGYKYRRGLN